MIPLVELDQLRGHAHLFVWGMTQRTHRLARLCRVTEALEIDAFVGEGAPLFPSDLAAYISSADFTARIKGASNIAVLCDGPLPSDITAELAASSCTLYDARYTLNLFFPPCHDDHTLSDVAFKRLWSVMLSRRGLAAAVRAQDNVSYQTRINYDAVTRPAYAYCMQRAAHEALLLGYKEIAIVEFGVAGGNGLLALEEHADSLERELNIKFRLYGFDCGCGLPPPADHRDQPYLFQAGDYPMDEAALRARLRRSELFIGPLRETARAFWSRAALAPPLGAIMFDLDYYSSTMDAFHLLTAAGARRLPRAVCYFDDLSWGPHVYENAGELQAIADFNRTNGGLKIVQSLNLDHMRIQPAPWNQQIFVLHDFEHADYAKPLRSAGHIDRLDLLPAPQSNNN